MQKSAKQILNLTDSELSEWAGLKTFSRGRTYKTHVADLALNGDGHLLAYVQGRREYTTEVWLEKKEGLKSRCTCPMGSGCKHAVALLLRAREMGAKVAELPEMDSCDPRQDAFGDEEEDFDPEYEAEEDDDWEENGAASEEPRRPSLPAKGIRSIIAKMERAELEACLLRLSQQFPEVRRELREKNAFQNQDIGKLVEMARKEMRQLVREEAWQNYWQGTGHLPDYSRLEEKMKMLLKLGRAQEVVDLGAELFKSSQDQMASSDDEGATGMAVSSCLEVALRALPRSALSKPEQLLWIIELQLQDEYSILPDCQKLIETSKYSRSDWSEVAKVLAERLKRFPAPAKGRRESFAYRRERLMNWLIDSYRHAVQIENILPLLEAEAPLTGCYKELVEHLLELNRESDAERWAIEGMRQTIQDLPGIASALLDILRQKAAGRQDWNKVAAYRAIEFFHRPSLPLYQKVEEAAQNNRLWPEVRERLLAFLNTGQRPHASDDKVELPALNPTAPKPPASLPRWPLANLVEAEIFQTDRYCKFPDIGTLIEVAIYEKNPDEVKRLYEISRNKRSWIDEEQIAEALAVAYPEIAIAIWKKKAEGLIALTKPSAYEQAASFLKKLKQLYASLNQQPQWLAYSALLRAQHKPKRRFIEILTFIDNSTAPAKKK